MKARPQSSRSRSIGERDREFGGAGIDHPSLLRLILYYPSGELVARLPYRSEDGPSLGTKAFTRVVVDLARTGLTQALMDLEAGAECVGTSGFTTREDVLLATASSYVAKIVKGT